MLSRNGLLGTPQRQRNPGRTTVHTEEKALFICIIEVEQAAGYKSSHERPVVALCDSKSETSWISSKFLEELGNSASNTYSYTARWERGKGNEPHSVNIRWSCDRLRQRHEEGTFFIEPKAQFKILFGCASRISRPLSKSYYSYRYNSRQEKSRRNRPQIRDSAVESFQQGIKDGVLLPLEKVLAEEESGPFRVNVGDLEMELDYTWRLYSSTEQALSSTTDDEDSSSQFSSYGDIPNSVELSSIRDSGCEAGQRSSTTDSANTSISCGASYQGVALTERLRRDRGGIQSAFSLQEWVTQPTFNEPWALGARVAPPLEQRPMSFTRCDDPTPSQQAALAAARAASEKESADYWIWDESKKNYKHYDEGCEEPVWYNPP